MHSNDLRHDVIWTPEKSGRFWGFMAENTPLADTYFGKQAGKSVIETVKRYISLKGRVIDYGSGPGLFMEHLFAEGIACEGLDFSKESLDVLEKKHKGNSLLKGTIHVASLPTQVETSSVDVVFFLETIEHLLPDQIQPTLAELSRIVRPGGYVIVTTPHNEDLTKSKVYCPDCGGVFHRWQHMSSFTVESMTRLMAAHGFKKVVCKPTLFCEYRRLVRWLLITSQRLAGTAPPNLLYIGMKVS